MYHYNKIIVILLIINYLIIIIYANNSIQSNIDKNIDNYHQDYDYQEKQETIHDIDLDNESSNQDYIEKEISDDKKEMLFTESETIIPSSIPISEFIDKSFDEIKITNGDKLVLFYKASNPESSNYINTITSIIDIIHNELPDFSFYKINGDLLINKESYDAADFGDKIYIFTDTQDDGIVKYPGQLVADNLIKHIKTLYYKSEPADIVGKFTTEKDTFSKMTSFSPKPMLIKYYKEGCAFCTSFKKTFQRLAHHYDQKIDFVEVECESKNDEHAWFCKNSEIEDYPSLRFFCGNEMYKFKGGDRSFVTVDEFIQENYSEACNIRKTRFGNSKFARLQEKIMKIFRKMWQRVEDFINKINN